MFGRAKTNLSGGIVGLANVGKSTFFQAITRSSLGHPANFPFATIEPEEAKVAVPSTRLAKLVDWYKPASVVPASFNIVDIAGLVRGAASGEGLGNAFLANIRAVDGLFQMVRAFDDEDIVHVENSVDPVRDAQIIHDELVLKDMEFVLKALEQSQRRVKTMPAQSPQRIETNEMAAVCDLAMKALDAGKRVDSLPDWNPNLHAKYLRQLNLLTTKPSVYVANISEEDWVFGNPDEVVADLRRWAAEAQPGAAVVPLSVNFESRLAQLSDEEARAELAELGEGIGSNLPDIVLALRQSLGLQSFFTAGTDEVREWTIRRGTTAPQAAAQIHADLAKTFITAQVTKFSDVLAHSPDEAVLRKLGKIATKGKDYVMEDGDIVTFRAGAAKR